MALTAYDVDSTWLGNMWDNEFLRNYAERDNVFPLFKTKAVPGGVKYVDHQLIGTLAANAFVPGAGDTVTLQSGTNTRVRLTLDKYKETSVLIDSIEELQSDPDARSDLSFNMTNALLGAIDTDVKSICASYTGLSADQVITTAAASGVTVTTNQSVSNEVERLITEAMVILDANLGANVGERKILLDSYLYRMLVKESDKQSPERSDIGFGAMTGIANAIQGASVYNGGTISRGWDAVNSETTVKFSVFVPDAILIGAQELPNVRASFENLYQSNLIVGREVYGVTEGLEAGFIDCTVRLDGDILGEAP
jgi:hypothetical protein